MIVIPAIDLLEGQAVRLYQGEYSEVSLYGKPVDALRRFEDAGASRVHVVDLDAARSGGKVHNLATIEMLRGATPLTLQVGGGLRSYADVKRRFDCGVEFAVLGSLAAQDPQRAGELAAQLPDRLLVGLDVRNGDVATEGWKATADLEPFAVLEQWMEAPFAGVITTDITRDGALTGPNVDWLQRVFERCTLPLFASGGVSNLADLVTLRDLQNDGRTLAGVVVGKAIYERTLDLTVAIQEVSA